MADQLRAPDETLSRDEWSARLAAHPVHALRTPSAPRVLGVHPRLWGKRTYVWELKETARRIVRGGSPKRIKFVICSTPRSGTTLLVRLLDQVPGISCYGEVLFGGQINARGFLRTLSFTSPGEAFGFKLMPFHLLEASWIRRPDRFVEALHEDGYRFIHLRRGLVAQSLSLTKAAQIRHYHNIEGRDRDPLSGDGVALSEEAFRVTLEWTRASDDWLGLLLSRFPSLALDYETDLEDAEAHQAAVDRICGWLGIDSAPVTADMTKESRRLPVTNRARLEEIAAGLGIE